MNNCKAIWRKANRASIGEKIHDITGKSLDTPTEVRWSSEHNAVKDLLSLPPDILRKLTEALWKTDRKVNNFTEKEIQFLNEFKPPSTFMCLIVTNNQKHCLI